MRSKLFSILMILVLLSVSVTFYLYYVMVSFWVINFKTAAYFEVEVISFEVVSADNGTIAVDIKLYNPGKLPVEIYMIQYRVYVSKDSYATFLSPPYIVYYKDPLQIKPNETLIYQTIYRTDYIEVLQSAVKSKEMAWLVAGEVHISLPLYPGIIVSFYKLNGTMEYLPVGSPSSGFNP